MTTANANEVEMNQTAMELQGDREIVISRTFNGPAKIVFEAYTNADLVRRWWAPKSLGVTIVSCDADVRVGGKYRYVLQPRKGNAFGFAGVYKEVTQYSRLVYTQIFEPMADGGELIATVTFGEQDGKTHMVSHEVYPSKEAREMALSSGMEHGMRETMDQLDELVESLS
ncbi:MAG: SRPBCC family protein [Gemmatimonadales bacterium]